MFRFGVEGGGGFVQQQDVAGAQQGAGNGDALGLSFAEAATLLVEGGVDAVGQLEYEVGSGGAQGLVHGGFGGLRVAHQQVVADGAAEEGVALRNVDEVGPGFGGDFGCGGLGIGGRG